MKKMFFAVLASVLLCSNVAARHMMREDMDMGAVIPVDLNDRTFVHSVVNDCGEECCGKPFCEHKISISCPKTCEPKVKVRYQKSCVKRCDVKCCPKTCAPKCRKSCNTGGCCGARGCR